MKFEFSTLLCSRGLHFLFQTQNETLNVYFLSYGLLKLKKVFLILKHLHFFADIPRFKNSYFSKLEFRSRNVCEHSLEEKMEWNWIFEGELIEKTSSRMLFHKHSIFSSFFIFEISRGNILSNAAPRTFLKRYFVHFDCSAKAMYWLIECLENLDTVLR